MRPFVAALLFTGCLNRSTTPTLVDPPSDPVTPVPTPVPTPAPTMPDGSTLLVDIPVGDWPWICDRVSLSQDAVDLTCPNFSIDWPARTREEDAAACVHRYQQAPTWTGCEATIDDFLVATNFIPETCAAFPAEVQAVQACINPPPTPPPTPPPPPPPPPVCEALFATSPAAGQTQVLPDADLSWSFTGMDSTLTVEVTTSAGVAVTGTGTWSGSIYEWEPDAPLAADTSFDAVATWCNGVSSNTHSFTTTDVGAPVPVPTLPDRTYAVDLASPSLSFVQPPGVGGLLQSQLAGFSVLVSVADATATDLELRVGIGSVSPFVQDLCQPTSDLPSSDFSTNPYFSAGPATLPFDMGITSFEFQELMLEGALTADADAMLMTLEAVVDTRPLVPLVVPGGADSAVCDLLAAFGVTCTTCAGGGDFCLPIEVIDIVAEEQVGLTLVERTAADVAADPTCP